MTDHNTPYTLRPSKYIEYDFPLREVNRLAEKEAYAKKPIYTMHKWWARRLSCVFRTVLLASAIDWEDWDALEPWKRDADGDFVDADGNKITHPRDYHLRVRDARPSREWYRKTNGLLERRPTAWERLYYRLDAEAEAVIKQAFDGQLILDPFMGGGTTIVEALRLGADVAGIDLNPVAWFTVKKETDGIDPEVLETAFRQVEAAVADEIKQYYKTRCPACGRTADVMYVFWVKRLRCMEQTCGADVPLYNSFILAKYRNKREVPSSDDGTPGMRLADGDAKQTHFLVCPACGEVYASFEKVRAGSTCPACGHHTPPDLLRKGYAGYGKYTCPTCGSRHAILETAKEQEDLRFEMYGLEATCPYCGFKGYKAPDEDDSALYDRARHRFEDERNTLLLPDYSIPLGLSTVVEHDLSGHGFDTWVDMFNERQLFLIARLRDAILSIDDQNAREYLLLAWSEAIEYYSMMVSYQTGSGKTRGTFSTHAYVPKLTVTEGNIWGAEYGRNTFQNEYDLIQRAMTWAKAPNDNFFFTDEDYDKVEIPEQLFPRQGERQLFCQSSENLASISDQEVAAVITDPPYYGNVMYAELSDYFYVWLRTALKRDYPDVFALRASPKAEEVVDQKSRSSGADFITKDEEFFTEGLTRIFAEAGRVLRDDGLMVFTFHHQANEAWASVLKTVLDAGFIIRAVYPVHAEMLSSLHIHDKANIAYDALIVCGKQTEVPEPINWRDVADQVYLRAERLVKTLEGESRGLLPEDIYVITIGKCLEAYSRHTYHGRSYVLWQDEPVSVAEALDGNEARGIQGIGAIVDQLVEEAEGRLWPAGLDPVTRFYVINFLGQSEVPYGRVKRRLMHHPNVSLDALAQRDLIEQSGGKVKVVPVMKRTDYLLAQIGERLDDDQLSLPGFDTTSGTLTAIDKLHLLIVLERRGALIGELVAQWGKDRTFIELARRIAELLDPKAKHYKVYQQIAEMLSGRRSYRMDL
jgi:adenine-specific DNA methylase